MMLLVILVFKLINDDSVVNAIFTAASYTYGPLLGLFVFGIFTKSAVRDKAVPYICVLSPTILYLLKTYVIEVYTPYVIGLDLIIINGFITFLMLLVSSPGKGVKRRFRITKLRYLICTYKKIKLSLRYLVFLYVCIIA
ncbi:hypothetical protein KUH03_21565 [Sphingobacterium sp. E70]|uniref:hypothetical protein n=1 Tax=Sphingobacterium sp. E70 TaxID=2853439 RepID=UPI00211C3252|nr:hypothetical protein [Sphingobacterium sp. E70]ULT22109.1 hypothetical protein KUH03_21565 [Sphingobacterium sp. E70]